ncbi:20149_t:CDS:2, partial [Gigaspora rosea]
DSSGQYEKKYKPFNKENTKIRKCGVIIAKQSHILPIAKKKILMNISDSQNLENNIILKMNTHQVMKNHNYQEPEQDESSSDSSESDEYKSHNLEKKSSEESKNDYYF